MIHYENAFGKCFSVKTEKPYFSNFEKMHFSPVVPCKTMMSDFFGVCG